MLLPFLIMDVVLPNLAEFNLGTMKKNKCKICRRAGTKLFLKGEKCSSPRCPMVKKPYPPGKKGKRRTRLSGYGKELREKQKLRDWYNLGESQFKKYVNEVLEKRGQVEDAASWLIRKLETRLDNVVFRLGFASSRSQARQLVSHGHFLVNNRKVNTPSYTVEPGDQISIKESSKKKSIFEYLSRKLKKYQPPSWLSLNVSKIEGKVTSLPNLEDITPPADISMVFEYYSR